MEDHPLLALVPDPHEQGLLRRYSEASVERRCPACRDWTSWDRAARPGVQAGQRVEGGMTGAEGECAGQLLNLKQRAKQYTEYETISIFKMVHTYVKFDQNLQSLQASSVYF